MKNNFYISEKSLADKGLSRFLYPFLYFKLNRVSPNPNSISIHFAIGARPLEVISSFIPDLMLSPGSLFVRVVSIMRGKLLKKLASYFIHNKKFKTRFCFGAPAKQKRLSLSIRCNFHTTYNRLQLGHRYLTAIINSFSPIANKISFQKII